MATKRNIRSIRITDEILEIIENQVGETFQAKFERLVYNCYMLESETAKRVESSNKQIADKREAYNKLCKDLQDVDMLIKDLQMIQHYGNIAVRRSKMMAENLDYNGKPKGE